MTTTEASITEAAVELANLPHNLPLLRVEGAATRLRRMAGAQKLSPIRARLLRYILDTHRRREEQHQRGLNNLSAG
jgi:hypothetical protein